MKNKRILVLPRYSRNGPSSRVRFYQFLPLLKENGFVCTVVPFFDEQYIEDLYHHQPAKKSGILNAYFRRISRAVTASQYDLIWMQYELLPWLPYWMEKILLGSRTPIIVDFDDAVFHRYNQHKRIIVRMALGNKISKIMRSARIVVAGNPYIADYAIRAGAEQVEIIPSTVDTQRYQPVKKHAGGKVKIGWVGTPGTASYLEPLKLVFEHCLDKTTELAIIGADTPPSLSSLPIENIPWSEETEVQMIQSLDIGIMPLPDNPFERGKCGYKLIQYMACGLPVVASPVGVNQDIVQHGKNGFLAADETEWTQALGRLKQEPVLRKQMGAAGRQLAVSQYDAASIGHKIIHLIQSI
jgi:glycosyltransferase involved in cell wall biosynthesis